MAAYALDGLRQALGQRHDQRVFDQRQEEDALPLPAGLDAAQNNYFKTFNRGQQDAAMGPSGYNRQWAAALEAPNVAAEADPNSAHKYRVDYGSLDLPVDQYSGPAGSNLQLQAENPALAALRRATPQTQMPPILR